MRLNISLLLVLGSIPCLTSCNSDMGADLVIKSATIWTGSDDVAMAQALAVKDGLILHVGDDESVSSFVSSGTRVLDGTGKFIAPGFIDSHVHFLTGGFRLSSVQLRDASSPEEFGSRIGAFAADLEPGTWITGGDWDHSLWGGDLPDRTWIDELTPDNPVWVNRLDGHMALANSAALVAAGISESVADVQGGSIGRAANERLTGLFRDNAMSLVDAAIPDPAEELQDRALQAAMDYVAAQGVTSVHDMSGWSITYDALSRAHERGELRTRVYMANSIWNWEQVRDQISAEGSGDDWLKIGLLKGFVDGSLGSHTAAFFKPYDDSPADSGFLVVDMSELRDVLQKADGAGLHPAIHAIGDRAISELIDVFEIVAAENGSRDRRLRIEHAQHIARKDFERFSNSEIIASMQPYHAIDDGRWAEKYISDRIETTYAFKTLLENDAILAFGSDWFVAPPTPLEGIFAAVTRQTLDGANPDGWVPEQRISVEAALTAYTIDAAYAGFDEKVKGSLEVDKMADFVVLSADLFSIPAQEIRNVAVERTFVGGREVYSVNNEVTDN